MHLFLKVASYSNTNETRRTRWLGQFSNCLQDTWLTLDTLQTENLMNSNPIVTQTFPSSVMLSHYSTHRAPLNRDVETVLNSPPPHGLAFFKHCRFWLSSFVLVCTFLSVPTSARLQSQWSYLFFTWTHHRGSHWSRKTHGNSLSCTEICLLVWLLPDLQDLGEKSLHDACLCSPRAQTLWPCDSFPGVPMGTGCGKCASVAF